MPGVARAEGIPLAARRYVTLLGVLWPFAAAAALWGSPGLPSGWAWAEVAGLSLLASILLYHAIPLRWGRHRFVSSFTESAVLAGLLLVPASGLLLAIPAASLVVGVLARRPAIKLAFNTSQAILGTAAAIMVHAALLHAGAPPLPSALVGMAVFGVAMDALLAPLLARLSGTTTWHVFRHRLLSSVLLSAVGGGTVGVIILALESMHPLALVALVPLLGLLVHLARLRAHVDREVETHRHLAARAYALVGCADDDVIARDILETAAKTLDAGKARLTMGERVWEHDPDPPREGATPGADARVSGTDAARVAHFAVWERPGKPSFSVVDRQLATLIGAQAAHMFANAAALRQVAQQRDTLARQERMSTLGTLVAGVAHEVNNPLTYLSGNLELAVDDLRAIQAGRPYAGAVEFPASQPLDMGPVVDLLTTAQKGVDQIGLIVRSLRNVAREGPPNERRLVDLNTVATDVGALLHVGVSDDITLGIETSPGSPKVMGSSTGLHQAVLNLAKNAIEALAGRPGSVRIRVVGEPGLACIEVSDDGPGIPPQVQARLFDPFFTTKTDGTGLGLSIVRSVAADHGGEVTVSSRLGEGTTFRLSLPVPVPTANPF